LYGCGTCPLKLKRRQRLKAFKKRVLWRIFGRKRDTMVEDWRKLHNEEIYNMWSSRNIIRMATSRRMRLARHVASMGIT
jgi:hypothetical protein